MWPVPEGCARLPPTSLDDVEFLLRPTDGLVTHRTQGGPPGSPVPPGPPGDGLLWAENLPSIAPPDFTLYLLITMLLSHSFIAG